MEITKILQKSRDFCSANFLLEIFKIHRLVWDFPMIFGCFKSVSSIFLSKLILILNFTNTVLSKKTVGSIFILCAKEIRRIGPLDLTSE